jgi:hypothetical protein
MDNPKQQDLFDNNVTDDEFDAFIAEQKQQEEVDRIQLKKTLAYVMAKRQERKSKVKAKQIKVVPREMREVHKRALEDGISRLKAVGCVFKILTPTGEEIIHDPSNLLDKRKQKVNRDDLPYAYGDLKKHYLPYLENMQVGDVAEIPYSDTLPAVAIQSSLSAHLSTNWGRGTYTTTTNKKTQMLEVLRLA